MAYGELREMKDLVPTAFPDKMLPITIKEGIKRLRDAGLLSKHRDGKLSWKYDLDGLNTCAGDERSPQEDHLKGFLNVVGRGLSQESTGEAAETGESWSTRRWSTIPRNKSLQKVPANKYPNLVLTSEKVDNDISWRNVYATLRLNSSKETTIANKKLTTENTTDAKTRIFNDALMTFCTQNTRRFFVGLTFITTTVRLYILDRSGMLESTPFDLVDEPEKLIRLMIGLTMGSLNLNGLDESFTDKGDHLLVSISGEKYRLLKCVFRSETIRGRGTTCWRAVRDGDPNGMEYAIKDTWTDTSRIAEVDILAKLEGISGIPTLIASEKRLVDRRDCTKYIRRNVRQKDLKSKKIEARQRWMVVTTPCATHLWDFSSKKELLSALVDVIEAHRDMLGRGILHRDISLGNIMLYAPGDESTSGETKPTMRSGLLIDVDYAVNNAESPEKNQSRKTAVGHRTGTLPFMAIDILKGSRSHSAAHDLESFFYVLVWICIAYRGPKGLPRIGKLDKETFKWSGQDGAAEPYDAGAYKASIFRDADDFSVYIGNQISPYFSNLVPCLKELRSLLFSPSTKHSFNHAQMIAILQRCINDLPDVDDFEDDEKLKKKKRVACSPIRGIRPATKRMRTESYQDESRMITKRMTRMRFQSTASHQGSESVQTAGSEEEDDDEEDEDEQGDESGDDEDDEEESDDSDNSDSEVYSEDEVQNEDEESDSDDYDEDDDEEKDPTYGN